MLILDEIVKHVEDVAYNNDDKALVCMGIKEYRQLAELLRELQERRKALPEIVRCGECRHKSFCPSKIDCGDGLYYTIDFCSNGKRAERRTDG